jgi:hypothetical protein
MAGCDLLLIFLPLLLLLSMAAIALPMCQATQPEGAAPAAATKGQARRLTTLRQHHTAAAVAVVAVAILLLLCSLPACHAL